MRSAPLHRIATWIVPALVPFLFVTAPPAATGASAPAAVLDARDDWREPPGDEDCMWIEDPMSGALVVLSVDRRHQPHFDIKPGSCPNPINVSAGSDAEGGDAAAVAVVTMSVLGNDFDVSQVDLGTVRLSRPGEGSMFGWGVLAPFTTHIEDVGTPFEGTDCQCHALNGDGIPDLVIKFHRPEIVDAFGLASEADGANVRLRVSGRTNSGFGVRVTDCIRVINHGG